MKKVVSLLFIWIGIAMYAHQPNLSSFEITKTNKGTYMVQFVGALTGFEGEIVSHYGKGAYKTPEEFKKLVLDYFAKSTMFFINDKAVMFKNPMVILGHETKVVAEVVGIPQEIKHIALTNTFFKDTSHNQVTVFFMAEGFPKDKYVLNNKNQHQLNLIYKNNEWQSKEQINNSIYYGIALGVLLLLIGGAYFVFKRRKN